MFLISMFQFILDLVLDFIDTVVYSVDIVGCMQVQYFTKSSSSWGDFLISSPNNEIIVL